MCYVGRVCGGVKCSPPSVNFGRLRGIDSEEEGCGVVVVVVVVDATATGPCRDFAFFSR